jgi:hypothetical protein
MLLPKTAYALPALKRNLATSSHGWLPITVVPEQFWQFNIFYFAEFLKTYLLLLSKKID